MEEISSAIYIGVNLYGPELSYNLESKDGDQVLYGIYKAITERILDYNISVGAASIMIDDINHGDDVIACPGSISLSINLRATYDEEVPIYVTGDEELWIAIFSLLTFLDEFNMQMGGIVAYIAVQSD